MRKLNWFLRDFGYDADLLGRDEVDTAARRTPGRSQDQSRLLQRHIGIRDAKMIRHAGEIALATGDRAAAQKYLQLAAHLNAGDSDGASAFGSSSRRIDPGGKL